MTTTTAIAYYVHAYRADTNECIDSHETLGDDYRRPFATRDDAFLAARCLEADAPSYGLEGVTYAVRADYA